MARILLLEDNIDLLSVLRQAIELGGHEVRAGSTGAEGITELEDHFAPDSIICDVAMPDMDGYAFLRHVRADPVYADTLFIVMSGNGEDRDRVLAHGADEYLVKPFSVRTLYDILARRFDETSS